MNQNIAHDSLIEYRDFILEFNQTMEEKAAVHNLNEEVLVHLLKLLDDASFVKGSLYWLSLARINELAILCAGNYAENCEFALVGDLLVNPRLVLIHVRGRRQPIVKKRHVPLTKQFSHIAIGRRGVAEWLKTQTIVETRRQALLPHLLGCMKNSGLFSESYMISIKTRESRVADLSVYLACQRFENQSSVVKWLREASPVDRDFMKSNLCRFDFKLFDLLGEHIEQTVNDVTFESTFLKS